MKRIVIAIDGPAGSGKSTISKIIAEKLNLKYIDTGAMYRAVTLKTIKYDIEPIDGEILLNMLEKTDIYFGENNRVFLDGVDVSKEIRMPFISERVSIIAAIPSVRKRLVEMQRKMASEESVIMDGRDIGTNVLKNAEYKIFLTASVKERANRRYMEMKEKGMDISYEKVCNDIMERDRIDSTRKVNPLIMAEDAYLLDTTGMCIEDVVQAIINVVNG